MPAVPRQLRLFFFGNANMNYCYKNGNLETRFVVYNECEISHAIVESCKRKKIIIIVVFLFFPFIIYYTNIAQDGGSRWQRSKENDWFKVESDVSEEYGYSAYIVFTQQLSRQQPVVINPYASPPPTAKCMSLLFATNLTGVR